MYDATNPLPVTLFALLRNLTQTLEGTDNLDGGRVPQLRRRR